MLDLRAGISDASNAETIAIDAENAINQGSKSIGMSALPSAFVANVVNATSNPTPKNTPTTAPINPNNKP